MLCSMVADPVTVVRTFVFVVTNDHALVRKYSMTCGGGVDGGGGRILSCSVDSTSDWCSVGGSRVRGEMLVSIARCNGSSWGM